MWLLRLCCAFVAEDGLASSFSFFLKSVLFQQCNVRIIYSVMLSDIELSQLPILPILECQNNFKCDIFLSYTCVGLFPQSRIFLYLYFVCVYCLILDWRLIMCWCLLKHEVYFVSSFVSWKLAVFYDIASLDKYLFSSSLDCMIKVWSSTVKNR